MGDHLSFKMGMEVVPYTQALCLLSFEPGEGWLRLKSQEWAEAGTMNCLYIAEESRRLCYLGVQNISHIC